MDQYRIRLSFIFNMVYNIFVIYYVLLYYNHLFILKVQSWVILYICWTVQNIMKTQSAVKHHNNINFHGSNIKPGINANYDIIQFPHLNPNSPSLHSISLSIWQFFTPSHSYLVKSSTFLYTNVICNVHHI